MGREEPPARFDGLIQEVHDRYESLSKTNKLIAEYITQHPNEMAMNSVNALAGRCGVHASSLVRFAQLFGFAGFKELQLLFQERLKISAAGPEGRTARVLSDIEEAGAPGAHGLLRGVALRDLAAIEDLVDRIPEADLARAIAILDGAETIFLMGQLRSEPIVSLFRYGLTMIGRRVTALDASGGLATHMAKTMRPTDALLAVSFRYYAAEVARVAEEATAQKAPIIAISDSTLAPLAKSAAVLFSIPETERAFSRSLAAPMCLAQALILGLAALKSDGAAPRIPVATEI